MGIFLLSKTSCNFVPSRPASKSRKKTYIDERNLNMVRNRARLFIYESDATWVSAPFAFGRLFMVFAVGYHTSLFIGIVANF